MFNGIENLKIILIRQKELKSYVKTENRKYHSLGFMRHGSALFVIDGKKTLVKEGEIFFLPSGTTHEAIPLGDGATHVTLYFDATFREPTYPCTFSAEQFHEGNQMVSNIADIYKLGTQADKYRCLSFLYSLLAYLSSQENTHYDRDKFGIISPAVEYLKKHIYDCDLKVDHLHLLCGISDTYFRQIFTARFGKTPQKYILSKRLSHAHSIITGGDFETISEVALSVGFNDPLYFSKAYKKVYGLSPTESYKQNY